MKHFAIAAIVVTGCATALQAADYPAPLQPPAFAPLPSFAGFYIAGGGGFGASEQRRFSLQTSYYSQSATLSPQGPLGALTMGYNVQLGQFLTGIEIAGRLGSENFNRSFGPDAARFSSTYPDLGGRLTASYQYRSDAGINVAARAGVTFGDTLIFTKVGLGMARTEDRFRWEGRGIYCTRTEFVSGRGQVCTESASVPSAEISLARWSPSLLAGLGIEHNIGRLFVRGSAEMEGIKGIQSFSEVTSLGGLGWASGGVTSNGQSDLYWTARAMGMVGFRF